MVTTKKEMKKIQRLTILGKTKKYVKESWHKVLSKLKIPIVRLKTLHNNLLQIDVNDLPVEGPKSPYALFLDWLLEIGEFGVPAAIVYSIFVGVDGMFHFIGLTIALGMLPWLLVMIIQKVRGSLNE